jgi:hypothetical protein
LAPLSTGVAALLICPEHGTVPDMRHIATLIAAIFIGPLAWILIAFGQDRSTAAFARVQSTGAFHSGDFVRPLVYLAAAGVLVGLIATLRFSPLGAVLTGVVYVLSYVWLLVDPHWLLHLFRRDLSVFGQTADPTLPVRSGTTLIIGSLLVVSVLSAKRWRRWPRPVVAGAGEPAPESIGYNLDHLGFGDEPDTLVNQFAGPPTPRTAPPGESVQPAPARLVTPAPPQAPRPPVGQQPPVGQAPLLGQAPPVEQAPPPEQQPPVGQAPPVERGRHEEPTADLSAPPAAREAYEAPTADLSAPPAAREAYEAPTADLSAPPAPAAPASAGDPEAPAAPVESMPAPSAADAAAEPVRQQPAEHERAPAADSAAEPVRQQPTEREQPPPADSATTEPVHDQPTEHEQPPADSATTEPLHDQPTEPEQAPAGRVHEPPAAPASGEPASGQDEPVAAAPAPTTGDTAAGPAPGGPADEPSAGTGSGPQNPFDRWATVESQAPRANPTGTPPAGSPWATPLRDASEDPDPPH